MMRCVLLFQMGGLGYFYSSNKKKFFFSNQGYSLDVSIMAVVMAVFNRP
jgi:hypothetical protein